MSQQPAIAPRMLAMIVDDHSLNRELLVRQLTKLGFRSDPFENGRDAWSAWTPGAYDIVITDCHMPYLDGYSLARAIRRREADLVLARMPVIAWTANLLATEAQRCRAAGMDDVMAKPSTTEKLKAVLARWVTLEAMAPALCGAPRQQADARLGNRPIPAPAIVVRTGAGT